MARSVNFYRDTIGLPLKFESTHWTEFATDGATLALHLGDTVDNVSDDGAPTAPGRCRPGFSVPDLNSFHTRMLDNGVSCIQEPKETFGARIAQYADPDGLILSVSEVAQ